MRLANRSTAAAIQGFGRLGRRRLLPALAALGLWGLANQASAREIEVLVTRPDGQQFVRKMTARGYEPVKSRSYTADAKGVEWSVELKPKKPDVEGAVLLPDGSLAEGARVVAHRLDTWNLSLGDVQPPQTWLPDEKASGVCRTDKQGRYRILDAHEAFHGEYYFQDTHEKRNYAIIAVHAAGMGLVPAFNAERTIRLRPWVKLTGQIPRNKLLPPHCQMACQIRQVFENRAFRDPQVLELEWFAKIDSEGRFEFPRVPQGHVALTLMVSDGSHADDLPSSTSGESPATRDRGEPLLTSGPSRGFFLARDRDITWEWLPESLLVPASVCVPAKAPTALRPAGPVKAVFVRVEGPDGKPIVGAVVRGTILDRLGPIYSQVQEVETDHRGLARLDTPAEVVVSDVVAARHIYEPGRRLRVYDEAPEDHPIVVRMKRSHPIGGTVLDQEGRGVPFVQVTIECSIPGHDKKSPGWQGIGNVASTDWAGRWTCDTLPVEAVVRRIKFDRPGNCYRFEETLQKWQREKPWGESPKILATLDEEPLFDILDNLMRAAVADPSMDELRRCEHRVTVKPGVVLRVTVHDPDGTSERNGCSGRVYLIAGDKEESECACGGGASRADTLIEEGPREGSASFAGNTPGRAILLVLARGHQPAGRRVEMKGAVTEAELTLARDTSGRLRVVDEKTGDPIARARIMGDDLAALLESHVDAEFLRGEADTETDVTGLAIVAGLSPTGTKLRVRADGYETTVYDFTLGGAGATSDMKERVVALKRRAEKPAVRK